MFRIEPNRLVRRLYFFPCLQNNYKYRLDSVFFQSVVNGEELVGHSGKYLLFCIFGNVLDCRWKKSNFGSAIHPHSVRLSLVSIYLVSVFPPPSIALIRLSPPYSSIGVLQILLLATVLTMPSPPSSSPIPPMHAIFSPNPLPTLAVALGTVTIVRWHPLSSYLCYVCFF